MLVWDLMFGGTGLGGVVNEEKKLLDIAQLTSRR
jgi:hypothetical protein